VVKRLKTQPESFGGAPHHPYPAIPPYRLDSGPAHDPNEG